MGQQEHGICEIEVIVQRIFSTALHFFSLFVHLFFSSCSCTLGVVYLLVFFGGMVVHGFQVTSRLQRIKRNVQTSSDQRKNYPPQREIQITKENHVGRRCNMLPKAIVRHKVQARQRLPRIAKNRISRRCTYSPNAVLMVKNLN